MVRYEHDDDWHVIENRVPLDHEVDIEYGEWAPTDDSGSIEALCQFIQPMRAWHYYDTGKPSRACFQACMDLSFLGVDDTLEVDRAREELHGKWHNNAAALIAVEEKDSLDILALTKKRICGKD